MTPKHTEATAAAPQHPSQAECRRAVSALSRVGDKWSMFIILVLNDGPKRFNELRRMIDGISQRMLTLTLRSLERDGLVTRTIYPTIPPRVDYELTELGRGISVPVEALGKWALENVAQIEASRALFDERHGS